jgi:hypothetical protein
MPHGRFALSGISRARRIERSPVKFRRCPATVKASAKPGRLDPTFDRHASMDR